MHDVKDDTTMNININSNNVNGNKRNDNDNSNTTNKSLRLNTVLLQTFFNFLNDNYANNINQIEKANETSDIFDDNNICHDFGVACLLGCDCTLSSMQPSDKNHFKPSRRMRYKFFHQRDSPYYRQLKKSDDEDEMDV